MNRARPLSSQKEDRGFLFSIIEEKEFIELD
jgi:hypothetical protein